MRYQRFATMRNTRDSKIMFGGYYNDNPDIQMSVYAGTYLSVDEQTILSNAGLLNIKIARSEITSYLQTAQALLESHGFSLDVRCSERISWVTADRKWTLRRNHKRGGKWEIQPYRDDGHLEFPMYYNFPSRDAAVVHATAMEET